MRLKLTLHRGEGDPVDVLVVDGVISEIGSDLTAPIDVITLDGNGGVLLPNGSPAPGGCPGPPPRSASC